MNILSIPDFLPMDYQSDEPDGKTNFVIEINYKGVCKQVEMYEFRNNKKGNIITVKKPQRRRDGVFQTVILVYITIEEIWIDENVDNLDI